MSLLNFKTVTVTTAAHQTWGYTDLPSGFTHDNCVIISANRINNSQVTWQTGNDQGTHAQNIVRIFSDNRVGCFNGSIDNMTIKVTLLKIS